jgi:hypothetical protein
MIKWNYILCILDILAWRGNWMKNLNETAVLNYYLELVNKGEVKFLRERERYREAVKKAVEKLRDAEGMNNRINAAKDTWKLLFEASMSYIDPDKRGYDKLFKYFDEYVNFEELIFASDSFYRDHTLHSLWVYFLGEYIMKHEEFKGFLSEMFSFYNTSSNNKAILESTKMEEVFGSLIKVYKDVEIACNMEDSVRCVAAITHDLGYPIKKIEKINKCIKEILPFFSINNYDEFNFSYSEIQQNFISSFIEFLSIGVTYHNSSNEDGDAFALKVLELNELGVLNGINKDELLKLSEAEVAKLKKIIDLKPRIERNMSMHWAYSKDFEDYKHGIMSAFLLVKNISSFQNIRFIYNDNMNIESKNIDYKDITVKQGILKNITNHTNENFRIVGMKGPDDFLTFIDELEEFSRISRANQSREYITEFCTTDIYMENDWFNIDFVFENDSIANLDPQRAFKGRCLRFLTLFDIVRLSTKLKIRLRCIGKLPCDSNIYALEIAHKFAKIMINGEEKNIPQYLNSKQLYTREEYEAM